MGQKVNPISMRIGVTRGWNSIWYATKQEFPVRLIQDAKIRKIIEKDMNAASVSRVEIERAAKRVRVIIYSGRPGMLIGRKGVQIEKLKEDVQDIIGSEIKLFIDIKEIKNPALDAKIVADNIAFQLLKRAAFRRVMKKTIQNVKDAGGEGVRVRCSGRLGGAEIARSESYKFGKIPLQTIRADIDYGFSEAKTTYGIIGIKVWIYKGDKLGKLAKPKKEKKTSENEESKE